VLEMRDRVLMILLMACLFLSPFLGRLTYPVKADARVIIVPSTGISTVQQAINQANPGDTILIQAGTYFENVVLNKTLSLVGMNRDLSIIDGNFVGNVILITAQGAAVSNLTIANSGAGLVDAGIHIQGASSNTVTDNRFTNNSDGISVYDSQNLLVSNNLIVGNSNYGVSLQSCISSTVSWNVIRENYAGVNLASSTGNFILANIISGNTNGILLSSSTGNVISANTVEDGLYGIWMVYASSNNVIYHNNLRNTGNAYSELKNFWDHEGEGNYWSNYEGRDSDRDGIGDTPYNLTEVSKNPNVDNYPLMGKFTEVDLVYNGITYVASVISNSSVSDAGFQVLVESGDRMLRFDTSGSSGTEIFCRVQLPNEAMSPPYILSTDNVQLTPVVLGSNDTYTFLYFSFVNNNDTVTIVASESLRLYNDLLVSYASLRDDLASLNGSYVDLMDDYGVLLDDFSQLQQTLDQLTSAYNSLLVLNESTSQYVGYYLGLLNNFSQLQANYAVLSDSYQHYLDDYAVQVQNLRNLMYIFATITAVFLLTTIYLSRRTYSAARSRWKRKEEIDQPESV
jgi:parallel beta-helix repeat protein